MDLVIQNYFSKICSIKKGNRFHMIKWNGKCFVFDGFLYSLQEVDNFIEKLIETESDEILLEKITNSLKNKEFETAFFKLSIFLSSNYSKQKYVSNKNTAFLNLNIGSKCNLNCAYCFRKKNLNKKSDIKLIKDAINFFISNNPETKSYSISLDLSSEVFLERDVLQKTLDYIFTKECYLFEKDEFLKGTALDFYALLPRQLQIKKCNNDIEALSEINKLLQRTDLLQVLDVASIKEEKSYLYQQSKIADYLPLWKLVRLNHWGLEAFYPEYVKHKDKKVFSVWIMSNGTKINEKDIKLIKGLEINPFSISLDGPEDVHNKLRSYHNGKGSYNDVMNSIKLLQKNNINVKVFLVLTKFYPYPFKLLKFLLSMNIYQVKMTLIRNCNNLEFNNDTIKILIHDYQLLFDELEEKLYQSDFRIFKFLEDDISLKPLHALLENSVSLKRCLWGEETIIDSEGDIYPCTYVCGDKNFYLGNVRRKSFNLKLENKIFVDYREKCKECWARYLCGGTCYFNSYVKKNDITDCEEMECIVNNFFCEQCVKLYLIVRSKNLTKQMIFN